MSDAQDLIESLALQPHPEGGFYRETYRAELTVNTPMGLRPVGTSIFYLLSGKDVSRFHRIDADEIWFHHRGGPLIIYSLDADGSIRSERLTTSHPQILIKAGVWFGAALEQPDDYCLVGCTVMPGFEFAGFELADSDQLLAGWPDAEDWIERLT
ncbi:cupin domain-containing protein [Algimonas porphyrae]|uniref:DUF985 domain-containing protein n=1 Tax=Algimonas porphyrae TaxID=1128113 RepID=A0ABQ5UYV3_9PROT|nr:cupin domain-containing protein [Algimonas porphyrae]GLQ20323.1 hypothetical protein GCM10007854_12780 [Algimonas porphyrae]